MNFYFFGEEATASSTAAMFKTKNKKEWILILPDDTKKRIEAEKQAYLQVAGYLTLFKGLMNPKEHSNLIENLNELSINERCSQSFLHEFGHIMQWRALDKLYDDNYQIDHIFQWFIDSGYVLHVDKRFPKLKGLEAKMVVYYLKESLAEDYRIKLNLRDKNKYILPNSVCHQGDFFNPKLLEEGIKFMDNTLPFKIPIPTGQEIENDRANLALKLLERQKKFNWVPGKASLTEKDVKNIMLKLKRELVDSFRDEVAASLDDETSE